MTKDLHITIIQSDLQWHQPEKNRDHFSKKIGGLESATDLIILPEMFTTGFSMQNTEYAEEMTGATVGWLKEMAVFKNAAITGSMVMRHESNYVNRMLWVEPDGVVRHYDKRHLFRFAGEHSVYTPGKERLIVEWKGWKILLLVCFDLRFPVWSRNRCHDPADHVNSMDYDAVVYVANWPEARKKAWSTLLEARAHENQCYVAGVNRIGVDGNGMVYSGDSAVFSPKGERMSNINAHEESVETILLSKSDLLDYRAKFPVALEADGFTIL